MLRNSVASAAVRAMAGAEEGEERASVFVVARRLYALVGVATGLLIAGVARRARRTVLDGELARDARVGGIGLGALTAVGIAASVNLDRLRAERMFATAAGTEIAAVAINLAMMVTLILAGADLALLIALSGALPLLSGLICAVLVRRYGLAVRGAGRGERRHHGRDRPDRRLAARDRALEPVHVRVRADRAGRLPHAAPRSASTRARARAQPALRARGRARRAHRAHRVALRRQGRRAPPPRARRARQPLHARAVRAAVRDADGAGRSRSSASGSGDRYTDGAAALTILVSYWLLYGALIVTPGFLVGAGEARVAGQTLRRAAGAQPRLALALTPGARRGGPAVATAGALVAAFPLLLRARPARLRRAAAELLRRALIPAYALGALLAGALLAGQLRARARTLPAVAVVAVAGVALYWAAYYALVLDPAERELARGLLRRRGSSSSRSSLRSGADRSRSEV